MAMLAVCKHLFRGIYWYSSRQRIIANPHNSSLSGIYCCFDSSFRRSYSNEHERITIYLVKTDGTRLKREGKIGDKLFDAIQGDPEFPGFGECNGLQACSTCHVIFTKEDFNTISKYGSINEEAENDLLDDISHKFPNGDVQVRTETSRLGCCLELAPEMNGMVIKLAKTKSFLDT